jgi:hypothetical protein
MAKKPPAFQSLKPAPVAVAPAPVPPPPVAAPAAPSRARRADATDAVHVLLPVNAEARRQLKRRAVDLDVPMVEILHRWIEAGARADGWTIPLRPYKASDIVD